MKCPHCGFVFEGTAHCPNCGKAPGKPGRDKAYYKEKTPQKPVQPSEPEVKQGDTQVFTRKSRPKRPPVVQQPQVYSQQLTPSQQLYNAPQTQQFQTKQSRPAQNTAKKQDKTVLIGVLCMIAIILIGVAAALIIINSQNTKNASLSTMGEATVLDDGTKVYDNIKIIDVIPAGTWEIEDKSLQITIGSDNSVSWIRDGQHYTPDIQQNGTVYNTVSKWEYPNGVSYVGEEKYPQSQYSIYDLYVPASEDEEKDLFLEIFLDNDTVGKDVDEINIYDWNTDEYYTLKRIK